MTRLLYGLSAALSAAIGVAHVVSGGALVVPPLFASKDVPEDVAALSYFAWHCGTVSIFTLVIAYSYAARSVAGRSMAGLATLISLGFGVLGIGAALFVSDVLWRTPAPYAFGVIGLVAVAALITDQRTA